MIHHCLGGGGGGGTPEKNVHGKVWRVTGSFWPRLICVLAKTQVATTTPPAPLGLYIGGTGGVKEYGKTERPPPPRCVVGSMLLFWVSQFAKGLDLVMSSGCAWSVGGESIRGQGDSTVLHGRRWTGGGPSFIRVAGTRLGCGASGASGANFVNVAQMLRKASGRVKNIIGECYMAGQLFFMKILNNYFFMFFHSFSTSDAGGSEVELVAGLPELAGLAGLISPAKK